jgi:hypothetical protein
MPVGSISYLILIRLLSYDQILKFCLRLVPVGDTTVFTGCNFRYTNLNFMTLYSVHAFYNFCVLHINGR